MSRGQHRQGNKHGKVSTRGERGTSKILRGIPNVLQVGGLPPVRIKRAGRQGRP